MTISPQAWDAFVKGVQGGADPTTLARAMVTSKAFNPNEARDSTGKWTSGTALSGTYEQDHSIPEYGRLRAEIGTKFLNAVKGLAGADLVVESKWNRLSHDLYRFEVSLRTKDRSGSAGAGVYLDRQGNMTLEQHDIGLAASAQGKGTGGKMVAALAAGFKAVGAGQGDVSIHINSNQPFWDAMREKHGGIYKAFNPDNGDPQYVFRVHSKAVK